MTPFRISWSHQPNENGLARVGQLERGLNCKVNGIVVGRVRPLVKIWERQTIGWYWYVCSDGVAIPQKNTANAALPTIDAAKKACDEYIRSHLKAVR